MHCICLQVYIKTNLKLKNPISIKKFTKKRVCYIFFKHDYILRIFLLANELEIEQNLMH